MIDSVENNIKTELDMLLEISKHLQRMQFASQQEKRLLVDAINSIRSSMKTINDSIPKMVESATAEISGETAKGETPALEKVVFSGENRKVEVVISKEDKERFIKEVNFNEKASARLARHGIYEGEEHQEFSSSRGYLKISNKFFFEQADRLIKQGSFRSLSVDIKKANIDILLETYVSMMFFSTLISLIVALFLYVFLIFFEIHPALPILTVYSGDYLMHLLKLLWIPVVVPIATFLAIYSYPSLERDSIEKKIDQELPFAVLHMSAIAGSGITPLEIFRIIGSNREYPYLRKEILKVLNQINLYGYDLITSLSNASKGTPSQKLAELFSGISTTVYSGGGLPKFFERRARTLLLEYRLEREKYTKVAETFMDVYISVIITAPMILMIVLIIISVQGFGPQFTPSQTSLIMSAVVAAANIFFIAVLNAKQPGY